MTKNMGLEAKIKSLEDSEQNLHLHFHYFKSYLASYSSFTLFLTFRWVWDFWNGPKWFPMVQNMGLESKIKTVEGSEQKL